MRLLIIALAMATLAGCTVQLPAQKPPVPAPAPSAQNVVEPAPAPRAKTKKVRKESLRQDAPKEVRKDPRKEPQKNVRGKPKQIRAVAKGEVPDCGLVKWAASTFSQERINDLKRTASAEQKRHAKACLNQ